MLNLINPLDGRYRKHTLPISEYFSEFSLMKHRILVEINYLILLSKNKQIRLRKLSSNELKMFEKIRDISNKDFMEIKRYENNINHDVKAVEYFLRNKFKKSSLKDITEWIHFCLTSHDVNNISYSLMLTRCLKNVLLPEINSIALLLRSISKKHKSTIMLGRTHGQPASPTTFGKEMNVFASRLNHQLKNLENLNLAVKLNGATGNYSAQVAAYPRVDWIDFTLKFVKALNIEYKTNLHANLVTTQIEPYDSFAEIFDNLRRINTIMIDLNQDIWRYISDDWLVQKSSEKEVGSSTMPHKINPIDFENSEGNLGLANSLLTFFSTKLPVSRLQRDLSDSTVLRNIGVALGYSILAYKSLKKGLSKTEINKANMLMDLKNNPQVITEAIQTILRREGKNNAYEQLKDFSKGKLINNKDLELFINKLNVSEKVKKELLGIKTENYIGLAKKLAVLK